MTSHDVVGRLRKLLNMKRIGHGGTLDPDVTGVLPVLIGNATRAADMMPDSEKEYRCTMKLGVRTDTEDLTGTVLFEEAVSVTKEEILSVFSSFIGDYEQVPPMYSARKVNGKKLVDLARKGIEIERTGVRREIRELELLDAAFPEVTFRVVCSKGTYIRTLCADIGKRLGTCAAMKTLVRTRHGIFRLEESHTLEEIETSVRENDPERNLVPTEDLFESDSDCLALAEADRFLRNGNSLASAEVQCASSAPLTDGQRVRMRFSDGRFAGLYRYSDAEQAFLPVKLFLPE
ncbi:MAG: tRNA pseudouridine(55) synthase TruB [Lachnospiraceae bacterium]|nr:tRNA pseudouridine(55) synthase TruB [Lachnospiraceae bacterium]